MIEKFKNPNRACISKKTKKKTDAQVAVQEEQGRNQSKSRREKITGRKHVIESEIMLIVVIIKIRGQRMIDVDILTGDYSTHEIKVIRKGSS